MYRCQQSSSFKQNILSKLQSQGSEPPLRGQFYSMSNFHACLISITLNPNSLSIGRGNVGVPKGFRDSPKRPLQVTALMPKIRVPSHAQASTAQITQRLSALQAVSLVQHHKPTGTGLPFYAGGTPACRTKYFGRLGDDTPALVAKYLRILTKSRTSTS